MTNGGGVLPGNLQGENMNRETLKALKESIKLWSNPEVWEHVCPLCVLHNNKAHGGDCLECPIYQRTRQPYCRGTPFYEWRAYNNQRKSTEAEALRKDEVKLLKSLLPKTKRKRGGGGGGKKGGGK
jgi:hypothetical protein